MWHQDTWWPVTSEKSNTITSHTHLHQTFPSIKPLSGFPSLLGQRPNSSMGPPGPTCLSLVPLQPHSTSSSPCPLTHTPCSFQFCSAPPSKLSSFLRATPLALLSPSSSWALTFWKPQHKLHLLPSLFFSLRPHHHEPSLHGLTPSPVTFQTSCEY